MLRNLGALTLLDPSGPAWPVMGVLYLYLYLFTPMYENVYRPEKVDRWSEVLLLLNCCK
jgi:hypothetical protein